MIQITMSFANLDEATAFLAARASASKATTGKPTPAQAADSKPTAEAGQPAGDAPSTKEASFDDDVVPALKAYSAKHGQDKLKALLKELGVERVPALKEKPDTWAKILKTCKA